MFCNKCGQRLNAGARFCTNCGASVTETHQNQYNYSYNYSNSDEDYKKAYIGKNYEKIKEGKFSIPAFIFGGYYFLYRKLWLYAIILIIFNLAITFFVEDYSSIIIIITYILVGMKFNSIYLKKVDQNIEKIKQQNLDKTSNELLNICRKKGGVSVASVVITFVALFTIGFIIGFTYAISEITDNVDFPTIDNYKQNTNDSSIEELSFKIPEGFEARSYNTESYKNYTYDTTNDYCTIRIEYNTYTSLYETAEEYLKSHTYTNQNDIVSDITEKNINNNTWSHLEITSDSTKEYKYTTIYNDTIYSIEYQIYSDDTKTCSTKYEALINSLKFAKNNNSV